MNYSHYYKLTILSYWLQAHNCVHVKAKYAEHELK